MRIFGTRAVLGRFFRDDEDVVPGARPVVVLTHRFWTRRLGADPHVLERPLRLNNREFAVVGVAEPGFEGVTLAGTDVWLPLAMVAEARGLPNANLLSAVRGVWHIGVGRLAPGRGRTEAQAELDTLMTQYNAANPEANQRHTAALLPTSRSRLIRQLLTETAVLFVAAGLVAVPITVAGVRLMHASLVLMLVVWSRPDSSCARCSRPLRGIPASPRRTSCSRASTCRSPATAGARLPQCHG